MHPSSIELSPNRPTFVISYASDKIIFYPTSIIHRMIGRTEQGEDTTPCAMQRVASLHHTPLLVHSHSTPVALLSCTRNQTIISLWPNKQATLENQPQQLSLTSAWKLVPKRSDRSSYLATSKGASNGTSHLRHPYHVVSMCIW